MFCKSTNCCFKEVVIAINLVVNDSKKSVDDGQQQLPDPEAEPEPEVEGALAKPVPEREEVI